MITVNSHEAKTNLSKLIAAVEEKGEIIRICRNGKEVAELRTTFLNKKNKTPKKKRDLSQIDSGLRITLYEDPSSPTFPDGWPEI